MVAAMLIALAATFLLAAEPPVQTSMPGPRSNVPDRTWMCRLTGAAGVDEPGGRTYGLLLTSGQEWQLTLPGGRITRGTYEMTPDRALRFSGDMGMITQTPRRMRAARYVAGAQDLALVFEFSPAIDGDIDRMVCRATRRP